MRKDILLINGFPGFLTNFNLVMALRRSGYNVSTFQYPAIDGAITDHAFRHIIDAVDKRLSDFYQDDDSLAVIAFCFGAWLVSQHVQKQTVPDRVKLIYMAPLLDLESFRLHHEEIGSNLDDMLFEPAPQLLKGTAADWSQGWAAIESEKIALDLPAGTSVVHADRDDLLDPNNIDLGKIVGQCGQLHTIGSPHHYFDDRRRELAETIHELLPTPA